MTIPSPHLTDSDREGLALKAYEIRRLTVEQVAYAQWGHIAGALSMAEILAVLYWRELRVRPDEPDWPERDRLVLSKAHCSPGLYAALALRGFFPTEELYRYCDIDGMLEGHTDASRTPGLEVSGGLLGMGLSSAQGMALGLRAAGNTRARAYCILGDGELNEGNIWEAAMSAAHYRLDNLIAIIDHNKIMAKDYVANQMAVSPVQTKFAAFGWDTLDVDGHDLDELSRVLYQARWGNRSGRPLCVIAHTVKGRGLVEAEDSPRWHTHAPSPEVADLMVRELAAAYSRPDQGYSMIDYPVKKETFRVS
jgi:transketolase